MSQTKKTTKIYTNTYLITDVFFLFLATKRTKKLPERNPKKKRAVFIPSSYDSGEEDEDLSVNVPADSAIDAPSSASADVPPPTSTPPQSASAATAVDPPAATAVDPPATTAVGPPVSSAGTRKKPYEMVNSVVESAPPGPASAEVWEAANKEHEIYERQYQKETERRRLHYFKCFTKVNKEMMKHKE